MKNREKNNATTKVITVEYMKKVDNLVAEIAELKKNGSTTDYYRKIEELVELAQEECNQYDTYAFPALLDLYSKLIVAICRKYESKWPESSEIMKFNFPYSICFQYEELEVIESAMINSDVMDLALTGFKNAVAIFDKDAERVNFTALLYRTISISIVSEIRRLLPYRIEKKKDGTSVVKQKPSRLETVPFYGAKDEEDEDFKAPEITIAAPPQYEPEDALMYKEYIQAFNDAMRSHKFEKTILSYIRSGMKAKDIAYLLDTSESTVARASRLAKNICEINCMGYTLKERNELIRKFNEKWDKELAA